VTSTLIFVEVLSAKLSDEQERQFRQSFRRLDHTSYDLTPPIAMKARDFRARCLNDKMSLKTPDAIHLATASLYNAELWTFDEKLLRLSGDERVDRLIISKPSDAVAALPLFSQPLSAEQILPLPSDGPSN